MRERYLQCLIALGINNPTKEHYGAILDLVDDCTPERRTLLLSRSETRTERRRRKRSEQKVDALREAIERVLCGESSKNEMIRILERAMNRSAYEEDTLAE